MHLSKASEYAINHNKAIGNFQNKNKQKKFNGYQKTQGHLHQTAARIGQQAPQRINAVTALYFWSTMTALQPPAQEFRLRNVNISPEQFKPVTHDSPLIQAFPVSKQLSGSICCTSSVPDIQNFSPPHRVSLGANSSSVMGKNRQPRSANLPEKSASTVTTSTLAPIPQDDQAKRLNSENHHVIALLLKQSDTPTKDLHNTQDIVKSAIAFSEKNLNAHAALASAIQKAHGLYGGHPEEIMSLPVQKLLIQDWITRTILGEDITTLVENHILSAEKPTHLTSRDLANFLSQTVSKKIPDSNIIQPWIFKNVILKELPILAQFFSSDGPYFPAWQHIKLHDFEFGQINAGLRFALSMDIDNINIGDFSAWGKILLTQLLEDAAPPQWWEFFQLAASIFQAQEYPFWMQNISSREKLNKRSHALLDYASAYELFIEKHNPVTHFKKLIADYKTRPQLAQQQIDMRCPGVKISAYIKSGTVRCSEVPFNAHSVLDKFRIVNNGISVQLPHIDELFQSQIDEIADSFAIVNTLLMAATWNQLPEKEINFWNGAQVTPAWAEFSAAEKLNFSPFVGANPLARDSLKVRLVPEVELLSVQYPSQEERIYALKRFSSGYAIERVDRDVEHYFSFLGTDIRPHIDSDFELKIYTLRNPLKHQQEGLQKLFEGLAQKHRADFAQQLFDYGFMRTTQETITGFLLSLIPFYTCLSTKQTEQRALSCSTDVISLLPVFGELSSLSIKLADVLGTASLAAARGAAIGMAQRGMLQEAIKLAGPEFVRYVSPHLETIAKKALKNLGLTTLRTIDPGIELIGSISVAAVKQAVRLGKTMTSRLDMLSKIEATVDHLPASIHHDNLLYGRLPGTKEQVPVVMLGGDLYQGHDVYVKIHPDTGTASGCKYILWPDGNLEAIPINMARRLQNIFEQGLSGKGAIKQGANWAASMSEINAALLRQMQQQINNGASLQGLAEQYAVPQEQLEHYISARGELTAQGHALVDEAEAGPSRAATTPPPYSIQQMVRSVLANNAVALPYPIDRITENTLGHRPTIEADENISAVFSSTGHTIQTLDGTYFTYDMDQDVFRTDKSEESPFVYTVDPVTKDKLALTMEQAIERAKTISLDQRTAVIKALGIDLDLSEILASAAPPAPNQKLLPKVIRYVWVGDRAISHEILETLRINSRIASQKGYQIRIYLSEKSEALNLERLQDAICEPNSCLSSSRNKVQILERGNFYKNFKQSVNFAQYQDAIDGNGGVATNFASAADILRYALIEKKGGLYMDIDDELLNSFEHLDLKIGSNDFVLSHLLSSDSLGMNHQFGTSFFGAHKGNTVLKDILQEIHRRYQEPPYQDFYKIPRPKEINRHTNTHYVDTLFSLTGPGVFNDVIRERLPATKHFIEMNKLSAIIHHPYASELFKKISEKIPDSAQITPLANCHLIGNLHSWKEYR